MKYRLSISLCVILAVGLLCSGTAQALTVGNLNPSTYEVHANLQGGNVDNVYVDRTYTYITVGDYAGLLHIRTENDDKSSTGSSFLTFDIDERATVYVVYAKSTVPNWMSDWVNTGDTVMTTDPNGERWVFSKIFPAGTVTLG